MLWEAVQSGDTHLSGFQFPSCSPPYPPSSFPQFLDIPSWSVKPSSFSGTSTCTTFSCFFFVSFRSPRQNLSLYFSHFMYEKPTERTAGEPCGVHRRTQHDHFHSHYRSFYRFCRIFSWSSSSRGRPAKATDKRRFQRAISWEQRSSSTTSCFTLSSALISNWFLGFPYVSSSPSPFVSYSSAHTGLAFDWTLIRECFLLLASGGLGAAPMRLRLSSLLAPSSLSVSSLLVFRSAIAAIAGVDRSDPVASWLLQADV